MERTSFGLVSSANSINVPKEWVGDFYTAYIPDGFEFGRCYSSTVIYRDTNGELLSCSEVGYGTRVRLDSEIANSSSLRINGTEAILIEKDHWTAAAWSANNRLFIVDIDGGKEDALRVAASVVPIRRQGSDEKP